MRRPMQRSAEATRQLQCVGCVSCGVRKRAGAMGLVRESWLEVLAAAAPPIASRNTHILSPSSALDSSNGGAKDPLSPTVVRMSERSLCVRRSADQDRHGSRWRREGHRSQQPPVTILCINHLALGRDCDARLMPNLKSRAFQILALS